MLWKRRQRIARAFFADVAPLDHFRLRGERICFEDLWLTAGLGGEAGTDYAAREPTSRYGAPLAVDAATRCVSLPWASGYRIVELRVRRPGDRRYGPAVQVHLVERQGLRHVLGVER